MAETVEQTQVRPTSQALVEIMAFSVLLCLLTALLSLLDPGVQRLGWGGVPGWLDAAGATLMKHIGWFLALLISLLLSFYVFVGGGQLLGLPHVQRRRRDLGFIAELATAATAAPFVLLLVFAATHPADQMIVLVLVPAEAAIVFLGAQLGGFIVFDRQERYEAAVKNAEAAAAILRSLRPRSRRPTWLVIVTQAAIFGCLSWSVVFALYPRDLVPLLPLLGALILLAVIVTAVFTWGAWSSYAAADRVGRLMPWLVPYAVAVFLVFGALAQPMSRVTVAFDAAIGLQLLGIICSTYAAMRYRVLRNWSVRGVARRLAARDVVTRYAKASRDGRENRPTRTASEQVATSRLSRLRNLLR
jgi:hypothetical protein